MKRDMDLVRSILFQIEECDDAAPRDIAVENYTQEQIQYHLGILYQAQLIDAYEIIAARGTTYRVKKLTWEGHSFLEAARNDTVWKKAKEKALEFGGSIPFEILKPLLLKLASTAVGLG